MCIEDKYRKNKFYQIKQQKVQKHVFSSNGVQLLIDSKLSSIDQYTKCCIANNVV